MRFKELLGKGLAIDNYGDGPTWGLRQPTQSDYTKLNQFLYSYLSFYAPEQEPQESQEMSGQSM